jgi:hypothetical protein
MLTERAYDEYRIYQEERLERLFTDMTRFYLGSRAEVVEGKSPEEPAVSARAGPPMPQESE